MFNENMTKTTTATTHEVFLQGVRDLIIASADLKPEEIEKLRNVKLVYGIGSNGVRGVTVYGAWHNGTDDPTEIIEVSALVEESWVQLAGTTLHELAHVLAGAGHGHDGDWKDTAVRLGFVKQPAAAGQVYHLAMFRLELRLAIAALAARLADGNPAFGLAILGRVVVPRPCSAGIGTKGGTSRGKGSGSRLRLWECDCDRPVKVRIASDDFDARCNLCMANFHKVER